MSNVNPFAVAARFAKSSAVAPPTPPSLDQLNSQAGWGDVKNVGLGALALGAGARGLAGLYSLIHRDSNIPKNPYPGALVTRIPVPVSDEDESLPPGHRRRKTANAAPPSPTAISDYHSQWWYPGAMLGAGALGLYGGWKGVDSLLQHRRQEASNEDVDDARKDFEQAMIESYPKPRKPSGIPPQGKLAADAEMTDGEKLSAALDELYDKMHEKQAIFGLTSPETDQQLLGAYGVYALGSGLLAGKMTYDSGMKNNGQTVLRKAIARRARRQFMQRPSEILAVPDEVKVPGQEFTPGGQADMDAEHNADPTEPSLNEPGRSRKIIRGIL